MKSFTHVYFIGIGGIGMSALARYFRYEGKTVAGYDRTATPLTRALETEGIAVHYTDDPAFIPAGFDDPASTVVVYTPAVPNDHRELARFRNGGFEVVKRSQMLGLLAAGKYVMAVAGTHGKTSTTTMLAWFNACAAAGPDGRTGGGSAFLGGISKNFGSNLVLGPGNRLAVEADEFDRSFLTLFPDQALITAVDADHLDIYGTPEQVRKAFAQFASQTVPGGTIVCHAGIDLPLPEGRTVYRYALNDVSADFHARNLTLTPRGTYRFDAVCPDRTMEGLELGIPGLVHVENCIGAIAMIWAAGFDEAALREAVRSFRGVRRRMDVYVNTPQRVYIDDYAHHPREIEATLRSLRALFPDRRITAVFQPHLYTRTRDFAAAFAASLSLADTLLLLPVYPAREEPIEGVDSDLICRQVTLADKAVVRKEELLDRLRREPLDVLVTFGAGDIDAFCGPIAKLMTEG